MIPTDILFDMDGTLLDSRAAVVDAVADGLTGAYRRHGLPLAEPDRGLIADCMGLPSAEYFERAYDPATVPPEVRAAFALTYGRLTAEAEIAAIDAGRTALYPGAEETLAALAERHRLLLFSNAGEVYFRAVIAGHGLERFFAEALCLEEAVTRGVATDKAGMVAALVADPAHAVVVGDRAGDIEAGRAAGARTVGCRYGFGTPEELQAADWIIDDLPDLLSLSRQAF
ncbi:HAD family hydrolase [bacterium]|nr:HAD family hydrolase [bacterium]